MSSVGNISEGWAIMTLVDDIPEGKMQGASASVTTAGPVLALGPWHLPTCLALGVTL